VPFVDESVTRIVGPFRSMLTWFRETSALSKDRLHVGARPIVTTPFDTSMSRRSVRPVHSITTCTSIANDSD